MNRTDRAAYSDPYCEESGRPIEGDEYDLNTIEFDLDFINEAFSEELFETALVPSSNGLALQKLLIAYLDPDLSEDEKKAISPKAGEIFCNMIERYVDSTRNHRN